MNDDEAMMKMMGIPTSFGKQKGRASSAQVRAKVYEAEMKPIVKEIPKLVTLPNEKVNDEEDEVTEPTEPTESSTQSILPMLYHSFSTTLQKPSPVLSMTIDTICARLLTGAANGIVSVYEFNAMDQRCLALKSFSPFEHQPITDLQFSLTGDRLLALGGGAVTKLLTREGLEVTCFERGDMYLRDPRNTHGHTQTIQAVQWHQQDHALFWSASLDGTLRLWDVNYKQSQQQLWVHRSSTPGKMFAGVSQLHCMDELVVTAALDGSLRGWKRGSQRPVFQLGKATEDNVAVTALTSQANQLVARSLNGSLIFWDIRQLKSPLKTLQFDASEPLMDLCWHPELKETLIVPCAATAQTEANIKAVNSQNYEIVQQWNMPISSNPLRCLWPKKLNQLFVSDHGGFVHALWNENADKLRGMALAMSRRFASSTTGPIEAQHTILIDRIIVPHALPLFREENLRPRSLKRQYEKLRKDPLASRRPEPPVVGHGHGGRLGSNLTQHVLSQLGTVTYQPRDEDPREALLKYDEEARKKPKFVAHAYKETQPETVLAEGDYEEYEIERRN